MKYQGSALYMIQQLVGLTFISMQLNGFLIRTLRQERNLSQEYLACELDCPRSLISKIDGRKGHKQVTLCTAYKLAKYFNVTIESII